MADTARSQRLISWTSTAGGFSGRWYSPEGHITLLKSLSAYNANATEAQLTLVVQDAGFNVGVYSVNQKVPASGTVLVDLWIALNAGDSCVITSDAVNVSCWLSGAVLFGDAQFPPATRASAVLLPAGPIPALSG
jgi:hypothetical protein